MSRVTCPRPRIARFLVLAGVLAWPAPDALAQGAADSTRDALAPTSSAPWNPPGPIAAERPWERVVRAPGRIVSIPFSLLGLGAKGTLLFIEQSDFVPKVKANVSVLLDYGILAGPASLGDRTGTGVEVGFNPTFLRSLTGAVSGSTTGYNRARVGWESRAAAIEYQSDWRPRDSFFGFGPDSRKDDASNFATQTQSARVELHYSRPRPPHLRELLEDPADSTATHVPARRSIRAWAGPRDVVMLDGRERASARSPLSERFPALTNDLGTRVEHFVYGAEAALDTRSGRPHWWKGWRTSAKVERFDLPIKAFAFHSASTPSIAFTRWTYEGEAGVSFWSDPRTLRMYARVVDQSDVKDPGVFLLSDLVSLGGREGLSGFEPGRFHDADLALGRLTYIFPVARYLEGDLHAEAGNVVGRLGDARLTDTHSSYGFALRVRDPFAPLGAVGVDWSRETVRFRFAIGGVE